MCKPVLYILEGSEVWKGVARALPPARGHEPDVADPPAFFMGNEARPFQNPEMFMDGGEGNPEGPGQLADGGFPVRQSFQHPAPRRIGQCRKGGVQQPGIPSHVGKYYTGPAGVKWKLNPAPDHLAVSPGCSWKNVTIKAGAAGLNWCPSGKMAVTSGVPPGEG